MPEFHLNKPATKAHPYYALDEFAKGYVEAMFFTNGDIGDDRWDLLNALGVERLTIKSVKAIKEECSTFLGTIMPDGCFARQWVDRLQQNSPARYGEGVSNDRRAGHMFWYARQCHGVACTDDYCRGDAGHDVAEGLQEACRKIGEADVEQWRGWIYHR